MTDPKIVRLEPGVSFQTKEQANNPWRQDHTEVGRRGGQKPGKCCSNCGQPGHRRQTCGKKARK